MPILKETLNICIEEGLDIADKWNDLYELVKEINWSDLNDVKRVKSFVLAEGKAAMIECRVRGELLGKRWKELERNKKRKRIVQMVREEKEEEGEEDCLINPRMGKGNMKPVEFYMILSGLLDEEVFRLTTEERREEIAEMIMEMKLNGADRKEKIKELAKKEMEGKK